ncbi:hypothetical protein LTR62_001341 [Meristemomyces frigidus]|uniref:Tyrosine specific protein phosphatases domain-containing protein n=1 Tax=Meristemomyces frigidus TaxID=1508187 RepID=A0AAN7T8B7_9PEZI|nr:hypothetical protein LTR62_001341 [Meristemomyces frigidus]
MATQIPYPVPGSHPFDNILNFRDVALFINHATGQNLLRPGLLYRSARPDAASDHDRTVLLNEVKLKTIIDLRTKTELHEAKQKFASKSKTSGSLGPAAAGAGETAALPSHPIAKSSENTKDNEHAIPKTLRIEGIKYVEVDLNGKNYSNALLKRLTFSQKTKLYALYVLGYRKEAISILGSNIMAARGLSGLAEDSLEHCGAEVKHFFTLLAERENYPVLAHCTQGKDRTGLTVLLVLMLCGIPVEAIEADYQVSERELERERREKVVEIEGIGLPESFADCEPGWAGKVGGWVEGRYRGVEKFLEGCGVGREVQGRVREVLMVGVE